MPDTADLLDKALQELRALHPKKIDLGLERIERVLEALGRPQDSILLVLMGKDRLWRIYALLPKLRD